jgi:transposase
MEQAGPIPAPTARAGMLSAMTRLSAIDDIARFPSAKHLVSYAGLLARIHTSDQIQHSGD